MTAIPTATGRETLLDRIVADMPPMPDAACRVDPELFFGTDTERERANAAKRLCATCVELKVCRPWVLANPTKAPYGVWGGMTEKERRRITGPVRECELAECHNIFHPTTSQHRYCVPSHAEKARRRSQAEHRQRSRQS